MDRRQFLLRGMNKAGNSALELLEKSVDIPVRWVRPPFAIAEPEFLLTCTRCDACIDACPEGALFALRSPGFPAAAGTPSLNLLDNACHLCDDWPCVEACNDGALVKADDQQCLPRFQTILTIDEAHCLPYQGPECGCCADVCVVPGALQWELGKPKIIQDNCIGCAQCRFSCITQPKAISISVKQML